MLKFLSYILLFITWTAVGQKIIEQSHPVDGITAIDIDGLDVFSIALIAKDTPYISVCSRIDGEGYENVLLRIKEEEGHLSVGVDFTPYFEPHNDKLSAHKVLAVELDIIIPKDLTVSVASQLASVRGEGVFKELFIELVAGSVILEKFVGSGRISTRDGAVLVKSAQEDLTATALSTRGTVVNELESDGKFKLEVESVNGDITLLKSQ